MRVMRQRGDSDFEVEPKDVVTVVIIVAVCLVLLLAILTGVAALVAVANNSHIPEYNASAAEFNAFPLDVRMAITQWTERDDVDPETFLITEKTPEPLFFLAEEFENGQGGKICWIVLGIFLLACSCATFALYLAERYKRFYLCSLPYDTVFGWVLFFMMFVSWPFMLISYICMRIQRTEEFRRRREKRKELREQRRMAEEREKAEVRRLAESELTAVAKKMTRPAFPERAHRAFVEYIFNGQVDARKARREEARKMVEDAKTQLQEAGQVVSDAQRALGEAKANLERVESVYSETRSLIEAEADWEAIKDARGVSGITYDRRRKNLAIIFKVRVPYEGELYDFGDYRLVLDGSARCRCKEIRSGVKLNHTSVRPLYHIDDKLFCFGHSLGTIEDYLRHSRYVEAITLIVNCLHSVNGEDAAREIPNCFRKVEVVEKAKRRILRRNKLKFWQRSVGG